MYQYPKSSHYVVLRLRRVSSIYPTSCTTLWLQLGTTLSRGTGKQQCWRRQCEPLTHAQAGKERLRQVTLGVPYDPTCTPDLIEITRMYLGSKYVTGENGTVKCAQWYAQTPSNRVASQRH